MLSIAILHFQNDKLTDECVTSVQDQYIPFPHEIFVLDNGSDIPYKNRFVKVKRISPNRGAVGGVNACFENASNDWVLYVSNDVRFKGSAIWQLFKRGHTDSVQAMPVVLTLEGGTDSVGMDLVWPGYGFSRHKWKGTITPFIPNITFLCHKSLWKNAGKFDEHIDMGYEDIDFGLRLKGRKIVVKEAEVIHLGNQTLGKTLKSHRETYKRNRRYVIIKNFKGMDRFLRISAMKVIDSIRGLLP